MVFKLF